MLLEKKRKALNYFMNMAKRKLAPYLIKSILFGSYAKGEATEESDIDLLMIYYGNEKLFLDPLSEISFDTALRFGELIEPIPISIYEYRARSNSSFFLSQVEKGKVLYKMDNKEALRLEATDYLSLGEEFLGYGQGAFNRGEYRDAIDDSYNGVELFVKTLILLKGEDLAHSHGGIIQQFGKLYILSGKIGKEIGKSISKALILRGKARYDPKADITEQDAKILLKLGNDLLHFCSQEIKKL